MLQTLHIAVADHFDSIQCSTWAVPFSMIVIVIPLRAYFLIYAERYKYNQIYCNAYQKKEEGYLTARQVGPTWEVRFCLRGPPDRNSLLGVICQNPTGGSVHIQP